MAARIGYGARTIDSRAAYWRGVAITTTDTVATKFPTCRAIHVGVAGDVVWEDLEGNQVTLKGCPAGHYPIQTQRIHATGTSATDLVALY